MDTSELVIRRSRNKWRIEHDQMLVAQCEWVDDAWAIAREIMLGAAGT